MYQLRGGDGINAGIHHNSLQTVQYTNSLCWSRAVHRFVQLTLAGKLVYHALHIFVVNQYNQISQELPTYAPEYALVNGTR